MVNMENKRHKISSPLLMFATTSVCAGCAMNSSVAINEITKLFLNNRERKLNKRNPVKAYKQTLIKCPKGGVSGNICHSMANNTNDKGRYNSSLLAQYP